MHLRELEAEGRRQALSTHGVVVSVAPEECACPRCGGPLVVQKSTEHDVVTAEHGPFRAHETVCVCAKRCTHPSGRLVTLRSQDLSRRVNRGAVYAYDLEVRIGMQRYVNHRQRLEIQRDLQKDGFDISTGQISILSVRFLSHLKALHRQQTPALREALRADGGYPLQLDATCEDGRGTLYVAYAGWRGWVLGAWKLSTERADLILPHLHEVVRDFGIPRAIMRDFGKAVISATSDLIRELGVDIPNLGCHRHLLSNIGEDLLGDLHDQLRDLVRDFRLRPGLRALSRDLGRPLSAQLATLRGAISDWTESDTDHKLPAGAKGLAAVRCLAQWVLDYGQDGQYGCFPYDRPYLDLYQRCRQARRAVDAFLHNAPPDVTVRRALGRLARVLDPVVREVRFTAIAAKLSRRAMLFDELRAALRIVPKDGLQMASAAATDSSVEQAAAELQDIKQALQDLTHSLRHRRPKHGPAQDKREAIDRILAHLDRHGDSLWGHVIQLPPEAGGGIRLVPRTNNEEEGLFHLMKHGLRRRSGRKVLTQDFEDLPADVALAYNLNRTDYVKVLCGTLEQLATAFAELDRQEHDRRLTASANEGPPDDYPEIQMASSSVPRLDRPVIRAAGLRKLIEAAARSRAPYHAVA